VSDAEFGTDDDSSRLYEIEEHITTTRGPLVRSRGEPSPPLDNMHDTIKQAVPTLFACSNLKMWLAVGRATPGQGFFLSRFSAGNLCRLPARRIGRPGVPFAEVS
jgi:hypothetical protein